MKGTGASGRWAPPGALSISDFESSGFDARSCTCLLVGMLNLGLE